MEGEGGVIQVSEGGGVLQVWGWVGVRIFTGNQEYWGGGGGEGVTK